MKVSRAHAIAWALVFLTLSLSGLSSCLAQATSLPPSKRVVII